MSLKDELDQFHGLFKQHLNGTKQAALRWVTATEVDWNDKTMTAVDSDDLPYYDVLLGVSNLKVKPKQGTDCLIAILEGNEATAFLLYADEADLVEYNNGVNGGLTNTPELKTQLDKMSSRIDGIIDALKNGMVVAGDGGASYKASVVAALESISGKEEFTKIEDIKITH